MKMTPKVYIKNEIIDKRHVVRVLESFVHLNHLCIVLEHFEMNLRECYNRVGKGSIINMHSIQLYAQHLLKALYFLKKRRIVHADSIPYILLIIVKPDNVLISRDGKRAKLCDFGSALYVDEIGVTEYIASRYYRAPEIILGCDFDTQIDMWGLGTTLFEAYTGKILFPGSTNNDMLHLMFKLKGKVGSWMLKKGKFISRHFNEKGEFVRAKDEASSKPVFLFSSYFTGNRKALCRRFDGFT